MVHTWQYNKMHPKLELYYFNAASSLYLEPLVNSIAHSGAGRLHADHHASTLVLPRRLPSSWSAKSRKSRLPTIGGALQPQSAVYDATPPSTLGNVDSRGGCSSSGWSPHGDSDGSFSRHALLPGQQDVKVNPRQEGWVFWIRHIGTGDTG